MSFILVIMNSELISINEIASIIGGDDGAAENLYELIEAKRKAEEGDSTNPKKE